MSDFHGSLEQAILDVVAGDKVKNNAYQDAEIW